MFFDSARPPYKQRRTWIATAAGLYVLSRVAALALVPLQLFVETFTCVSDIPTCVATAVTNQIPTPSFPEEPEIAIPAPQPEMSPEARERNAEALRLACLGVPDNTLGQCNNARDEYLDSFPKSPDSAQVCLDSFDRKVNCND